MTVNELIIELQKFQYQGNGNCLVTGRDDYTGQDSPQILLEFCPVLKEAVIVLPTGN